jgi:hypothetical protein
MPYPGEKNFQGPINDSRFPIDESQFGGVEDLEKMLLKKLMQKTMGSTSDPQSPESLVRLLAADINNTDNSITDVTSQGNSDDGIPRDLAVKMLMELISGQRQNIPLKSFGGDITSNGNGGLNLPPQLKQQMR